MRIEKPAVLFAMLLLATGLAPRTFAENAQFVLSFGGQPGLPLTHAYDYGLPAAQEPSFTMRIPIVDKVVNGVFHDTEMKILREGKLVDLIHAERAFTSLQECTTAKDALDRRLKELLPANYSGAAQPWQHQSDDGVTVGAAWCQTERQLPYPILHLELARAASVR